MDLILESALGNGHQFPGIRKAKNGTYAIDCIKYDRGERVHIYLSGFLTAEEASLALPSLVETKLAERAAQAKKSMLFKEFIARFEEYRLLHVRFSSMQFGRSAVNTYMKEDMDKPFKSAFTYERIETIYSTLIGKANKTAAWKNRVFGVFRQMAEAAFKWKMLDSEAYRDIVSILENIPENRGGKKEKIVWSAKEREAFMGVINDPTDKVLFTLFAALGARIGEFAGLTWDCFDAKKGEIVIKQQLVYADKNKWVLTKELKTAESYRVCKLSKKVATMLKEYKDTTSGEGFIFHSAHNPAYPLSKASIRRKMYAYADKAKVKRVTPHALRHCKAMDLMRVCKNMQEVKAAARYLGHSATMMIDTYGHSDENSTAAVIRRLERE